MRFQPFCAVVVSLLILAVSIGCEVPSEPNPVDMPEPEERSVLDSSGGVGSVAPDQSVPQFARGYGWSIIWSTNDAEGAQPREVLDALIKRMETLQQTPQGGDNMARAIWSLHEARDLMDGTNPITQQPLGNTNGEKE